VPSKHNLRKLIFIYRSKEQSADERLTFPEILMQFKRTKYFAYVMKFLLVHTCSEFVLLLLLGNAYDIEQ
jgi:hypothetical protein